MKNKLLQNCSKTIPVPSTTEFNLLAQILPALELYSRRSSSLNSYRTAPPSAAIAQFAHVNNIQIACSKVLTKCSDAVHTLFETKRR